jgi:Myb-like DNA-binding domain
MSTSYSGENGLKWIKNGYGQGVHAGTISGKFSKEESEKVRVAIKAYCDEKNITISRLCSECDHKAELKGAWMEIAKVLPDRSVQSVYRHGLRQLHPFKRGLWTEDECDSLELLVAQIGKKWAAIQDKLNRSADSCRDKYREMSDCYIRGRWKENETEQLKRIIREYLHAEPSADIKELGRMVEAKSIKIPWSVISKKMIKRSRLSCFKKWQKMTGLYSPSDQPICLSVDGSFKHETIEEEEVPKAPPARRAKPAPIQVPKHIASTAGAAAALASSVNNPIGSTSNIAADVHNYLLTELASMDAARMSDVDWTSVGVDHAQERWMELFEEFQANVADDSVLTMPLSSVAQMILDRKASAEQAAETVEAVDLPNPESLQPRLETV